MTVNEIMDELTKLQKEGYGNVECIYFINFENHRKFEEIRYYSNRKNYEEMTIDELKKICRYYKIRINNNIAKNKLVKILNKHCPKIEQVLFED